MKRIKKGFVGWLVFISSMLLVVYFGSHVVLETALFGWWDVGNIISIGILYSLYMYNPEK